MLRCYAILPWVGQSLVELLLVLVRVRRERCAVEGVVFSRFWVGESRWLLREKMRGRIVKIRLVL